MKLNKNDKEILFDLGVPEGDINQIEEASHAKHTTYELDGQPISREKVIELLGRRSYLAGLARSAFHWSAAQFLPDGREVRFDSGNYFRA